MLTRLRLLPFLALALALLLAGCTGTGYLKTSNVEGTFNRVADRHDAYVRADPSLDDLHRQADLNDTALLRAAIRQSEAAPATRPATTQP